MSWNDDMFRQIEQLKKLSQIADPLSHMFDARTISQLAMEDHLDQIRGLGGNKWLLDALDAVKDQEKEWLKSVSFGLGASAFDAFKQIQLEGSATGRMLESVRQQIDLVHGRTFPKYTDFVEQMGAATLAEQLSEQLGRLLPRSISDQWQGLISADQLEALQRAAENAAARMDESWDDDDEPRSSGELQERFADAELDETAEIIRATVVATVAELERRGALGGASAWKVAWVTLFIGALIALVLDVMVTPVLTRLYRGEDQAKQIAPADKVALARPTLPVKGRIAVTTGKTTLRAGPHSTQAYMGTVGKGQFLRVLKRRLSWVQVRFVLPDGDGAEVTSWVRVKRVRSVEAETRRMVLEAMRDTTDPE